METITTKDELLQRIHSARAVFSAVLAGLDDAQLQTPGVMDGWSIKDILAHITDWELLMSTAFAEAHAGQAPSRWPANDAAVDALNAGFAAANQSKSLAQVQDEFQQSLATAVTAVNALSTNELFDPDTFSWRHGNPLWHMVGGNTFWHYEDHLPQIEHWLANQ